jgi:hypothetical protein
MMLVLILVLGIESGGDLDRHRADHHLLRVPSGL